MPLPRRRLLLVAIVVTVLVVLLLADRAGSAPGAAPLCPPGGCPGAAPAGAFSGLTSQDHHIRLDVAPGGGAVIAVRFTLLAICPRGRVSLQVIVRRGADPWAILDSGGRGFSDWFAGPIGHAFHLTGTFSTDRRTATGTLHLRARLSNRGMCDSGHVDWAARTAPGRRLAPERGGAITLTAYRSVAVGTPVAAVLARLGAPADRVTIVPAGLLSEYGHAGGLVYRRAGRAKDLLSYGIRRGRIAVREL